MRRLAMGSSAQSFDGSGSAGSRLDGRSLATRGASGKVKGSGAPADRRLRLAAPLAVVVAVLAFGVASASAAAPVVNVGVTIPSETALNAATLSGTINPGGLATTYHFEYGKTTSYGDNAPVIDASAGSGSADVIVSRLVTLLDLNTTYHYRLVATNSAGTTVGEDLTFDTGPNLANGLHYEMVSPVETNASSAAVSAIAPGSDRVGLTVGKTGFGGTESMHGLLDSFISDRTPAGWVTRPMTPPSAPDNSLADTLEWSDDLGTFLIRTQTKLQFAEGVFQWGFLKAGEAGLQEYTQLKDPTRPVNPTYSGGSKDFTHLLASTGAAERLLATDNPAASTGTGVGNRLYEMVGNPPAMRRVDLNNSGAEISPCMAEGFGGFGRTGNAISADGSKIVFSARLAATAANCATAPVRLFTRVNGTSTVTLSASECTRPDCSTATGNSEFQSTSDDGSRVAFKSTEQLTNSDTDATADLYIYDFAKPAGQRLTQASAGDATDPTPGSGAQVLGLMRMSQDGSRVFFAAKGVLTTGPNSGGQVAAAGGNNLYVYEPATGKTKFIAAFTAAEDVGSSSSTPTGLWSGNSNARLADVSGRYLLFSAVSPIGVGDTDAVADLYRYDAQTAELLRVSPGNTADPVLLGPNAESTGVHTPSSPISDDGSTIIFTTAAKLQVNDVNGAPDIYIWKNGSLSLLSDGQALTGTEGGVVSASGDEVGFGTGRHLVPEDVDTTVSAYVARPGPDVEHPAAVLPPVPCGSSDLCRGAAPAAPADPAPVTPSFSGPGNEATPKPKPKPHKKKHHKKKQRSKHRAHRTTTRHVG